jgi:hypothetical protein
MLIFYISSVIICLFAILLNKNKSHNVFDIMNKLDDEVSEIKDDKTKNTIYNIVNFSAMNPVLSNLFIIILAFVPGINLLLILAFSINIDDLNRESIQNNDTEIINQTSYLANQQILDVINLFDKNSKPKKIILYNNKKDIIRYLKQYSIINRITNIFDIPTWLGKDEGTYFPYEDIVAIYVFSQEDSNDKQTIQLSLLETLIYELKYRYQTNNNKKFAEDNFATRFISENSKIISQIMGWKDEWELKEE